MTTEQSGVSWRIKPLEGTPSPDCPPVLLVARGPVSPSGKAASAGGQVDVGVQVGADGEIANAVVKRSTNPSLEKEALKAVAHWRFLPKRKNGTAVPADVVIPLLIQPAAKPTGGQGPASPR